MKWRGLLVAVLILLATAAVGWWRIKDARQAMPDHLSQPAPADFNTAIEGTRSALNPLPVGPAQAQSVAPATAASVNFSQHPLPTVPRR